jgi:hypothetical protein
VTEFSRESAVLIQVLQSRDHPGLKLGNCRHLLQQEFACCAFDHWKISKAQSNARQWGVADRRRDRSATRAFFLLQPGCSAFETDRDGKRAFNIRAASQSFALLFPILPISRLA